MPSTWESRARQRMSTWVLAEGGVLLNDDLHGLYSFL